MSLLWLAVCLLCGARAYAQTGAPPEGGASATTVAPKEPPHPQPSATPEPKRAAPTGVNVGLPRLTVGRETPRETTVGFLDAARSKDFNRAAQYLNLSDIPAAQQRARGPVLAEDLYEVLQSAVWLDIDAIPDEPAAGDKNESSPKDVQIATITMPSGTQGIRLSRVTDAAARPVWVFSSSTVKKVPELHTLFGKPRILDDLPPWMRGVALWGLEVWQWAGLLTLLVVSWGTGYLFESVLVRVLKHVAKRRQLDREHPLWSLLEGPTRLLAWLITFAIALPALRLPASAGQTITRVAYVGIIFAVVRGSIGMVGYGAEVIQERGFRNVDEEVKKRAIATRVATLRRIGVVLVVVVGLALGLMQFPSVRTVGLSLLGSAGIAGAVLGFAAQKTFSNIFAGVVISLTQPIRIGDTVVVEQEWGQIEEIGTTHVMVKLWDLRRLMLPISYFLEKPFENWTRTGAALMGVVQVWADYSVNVGTVREELDRILRNEPLWNGESKSLIVESMSENVVVLRVTVSADNSGNLWDLRCKIREAMLALLQREGALPSRRVRMDPSAPEPKPAG